MKQIPLSDIRYRLPSHHRRWVRTALAVGACAYLTMSIARVLLGTPLIIPELVLFGICAAAYVGEPRFPRLTITVMLVSVWLEMMWSLSSSPLGVRDASSAAIPVLMVTCALLLGAKASWTIAIVTSLSVPLGLTLGKTFWGGKGLESSDVEYLIVIEVTIYGIAILLNGFLHTLSNLVRKEQANAARWREFVEEAPDAMVAVNPEGTVVAFNRLAEEYFELKRGKILGQPFAELQRLQPECFKTDSLPSSSRPQQMVLGKRTLETRLRREKVHGETSQWLFVLRDVSERETAANNTRLLRSQLNHIQKMDAIGQLAGGVAHDFNNLLTAVSGAAFALQDLSEKEAQEIGAELLEASQQGAALTRQLLTFARREVVQARVVDLEDAVEASRPLLSRVLGERVRLDIDTVPGCCVRLDEGQLEQVILNFAANARDATGGTGTFTLSVRPKGDKVILRASDTGHGMDEQTIEHIFEPFFTTKASNQGTGLGLATIHGIVSQWHGTIEVESKVGQGTTFVIQWPQAEDEVTGITTTRISDPANVASGKVLLVEDNEPARRFIRRILHRAGYSVTEASSAEEALAICHDHACPDILISDVIMPGMTGVELATRLHEKWKSLPILFVSGYVDDVLADWPYDTTHDLLLKPFTPDALLDRMERKLKKRRVRPTTDGGSSLFDPVGGRR